MPKLMLVASRVDEGPAGGRALLSRLIQRCLERLLGEDLVVHELDPAASKPLSRIAGMCGYIDGLTPTRLDCIIEAARAVNVERIIIDGSNRGVLAAAIRKRLPHVEILTFFHNVEGRFFWGSLKRQRSVHALGVLLANYFAERAAVRHSDRLIVLSARDSDTLARLYRRRATDILPLAMEDRYFPDSHIGELPDATPFLLFVGGAFYANQDGITWFVEHVVPKIDIRTCIVGHGMETLRSRLERAGKVEVIGPVDRLQDWYLNARAVIAPIFDGSGMKTKVAEALMFGKKIAGTSEAFSGYEDVADNAGWVCDTRDDFVSAIKSVEREPPVRFDPDVRALYEQHHSEAAVLRRLGSILR